jgi:hypothetical protein
MNLVKTRPHNKMEKWFSNELLNFIHLKKKKIVTKFNAKSINNRLVSFIYILLILNISLVWNFIY